MLLQTPVVTRIFGDRIFGVIDSGGIQTLIGVMGGLVGTFLDGRYFSALAIFVPISLYHSKALQGISTFCSILIHMIFVVAAFVLLFYVGINLNRSRPHTFTPADYALAVKEKLPLPIFNQITNVYNSITSQAEAKEPLLELSEVISDSSSGHGVDVHIDALNKGSSAARKVINTEKASLLVRSNSSEDALFKELEKAENDDTATQMDIDPGEDHKVYQPIAMPAMSEADKLEYQHQTKVLYMGFIDSYSDSHNKRHYVERCMYSTFGYSLLNYCHGHNSSK